MLDRAAPAACFSHETIGGISAAPRGLWDGAYPGEAEDWAYHAACDAAVRRDGGQPAAVVSAEMEGVAAAAPLFEIVYPLDTPLQGRLAGSARALRRWAPQALEWKALVVGSTLTERAHVAVRRDLAGAHRDAAVAALIEGAEAEARRRGAAVVAFKDLAPDEDLAFGPALAARRYVKVRSLPVAVLDLGAATSSDDYLAALSAATRKDIRRKLRSRGRLTVEHKTPDAADLAQIRALYVETQTSSEVRYGDFEELPEGYFEAMAALGPEKARFVLYRADDRLVAFNLLLLAPDRVVDKFIGMSFPLARELNLYAVSWMENVSFALGSGRRYLQTGQTAYADKLRFGSALEARTIWAKHRFAPLNVALRAFSGLLAFDRWDPVLRARVQGGVQGAPPS